MKTTLAVALLLLLSAPAFASEYGEPGTMSIGGRIGFLQREASFDDGGTSTSRQIELAPEFGYYPAEHVEAIGELRLRVTEDEEEGLGKETATAFGALVGGGYFFDAGSLHVGPVLLLGYESEEIAREDSSGNDAGTDTKSGPLASLQLQLKIPVGDGGLITGLVGYDHQVVSLKTDAGSDSGTLGRFRTGLGFSVFF